MIWEYISLYCFGVYVIGSMYRITEFVNKAVNEMWNLNYFIFYILSSALYVCTIILYSLLILQFILT
jgi:cytosine/uracil/thiamine/allantoin permease